MGLRREAIFLLMQEGLRRSFKGKILTLGKQDIWTTYDDILKIAEKVNYPLRSIKNIELSSKPELKAQKFVSDRSLFHLLGFDEVRSIDASEYENADILFDLNTQNPPVELLSGFDVVLDPGTIEHVFHIPNSLKNIFQFVQEDGRVIHISPSSNHLDHGFYMFSPTLFWDYYSVNKFELNNFKMIQYRPQSVFPWKIGTYVPGSFNFASFGGLDNSMYAILCIVTKAADSSCDQIPQQYNFAQNLWKQKGSSFENHWVKASIKKFPLIYRMLLPLSKIYKKMILQRKFEPLL